MVHVKAFCMNLDFKRQISQQTSFVALVPLSQKTFKKLHICQGNENNLTCVTMSKPLRKFHVS
jgi:hypothetical protein